VTVGIWARVGSRHEAPAENGASHFLEHLLFKGTARRSCEELKRLVEGVGGTFNAFTGEEATCFYVKMPFARHLPLALDVLSDMVTGSRLPPEEVEKERNVILEEIKMYRDIPAAHVDELFQALVFPDHPLGRFIAGTPETIAGLSRETLSDYWDRHYRTGSLVACVAGDFRVEAARELVGNYLAAVKPGPRPVFEAVRPAADRPDFSLLEKETEQAHFCLGGRGCSDDNPHRWPLSVLSVILGGNMSSRLFVEVREKRGLAYQISAGHHTFRDAGIFTVDAGTSPGTLKEALRVILAELARVRDELVPEEELTRARDYVTGQFQMHLEGTAEYMNFLGGQLATRDRIRPPEEIIARIAAVTAEDVRRAAAAVFTGANLRLAVIGPPGSTAGLRELVSL
ncbi:MAG TPA: pitrilysin family protein, partial [bacterium]|nr:pitrilysin family protein [bacterium]